jgi:hypothetical protein
MKAEHVKTPQNTEEVSSHPGKKGNGAKKGTETPPMPEKNRTNRAKRLANPGDGRIITKMAKNSSFTP